MRLGAFFLSLNDPLSFVPPFVLFFSNSVFTVIWAPEYQNSI